MSEADFHIGREIERLCKELGDLRELHHSHVHNNDHSHEELHTHESEPVIDEPTTPEPVADLETEAKETPAEPALEPLETGEAKEPERTHPMFTRF